MKKKTKVPAPPPLSETTDVPEIVPMLCPKCHAHWGNARIQFGQTITKEDFTLAEDLNKKLKLQKSGLPICPLCGFKYTPYAVYALLVSTTAKKQMEKKVWSDERFQR